MRLSFKNRIGKICALVAAASILPVLAYGGTDNGKGNNGQNNGNQNGHHKDPIVPEANALWVLIPVVGTILLFSTRQLYRSKA